LLVFTEPSLGEGARPLAWRGLKESLGGDWLVNRVNRIAPDLDFPSDLAEVLETARHHAADKQLRPDDEGPTAMLE